MSYDIDRFFAAVLVLAGHGHIKQRLRKAFEENLADLNDEDLPVSAAKTFAGIHRQMHQVAPLNGEGAVCASIRKMSTIEASECAESIVSLHRELLRNADDGQSVLPLEQKGRAVVPPFLVKSV
jgi:hypothetical protein